MTYDLFMEDCDLLEAVEIQLEQNKVIENYVTESELMISLYENQRILIEQDTNIFMILNYQPVTEGVIETIVEAIKKLFKRIKELIEKFINFITGKSKDKKEEKKEETVKKAEEFVEKVNVEEVFDELDKEKESFQKQHEENMKIVNDCLKQFEASAKQAEDFTNKMFDKEDKKEIQRLKQQNESLKQKIENFYNRPDKKYNPIEISDTIMRSVNYNSIWTELDEAIEVCNKIINLIKNGKIENIDNEMSKLQNFKTKDKLNISEIEEGINIEKEYCSRKEYMEKYYRRAKTFFRNYDDNSSNIYRELRNTYHDKILPLEREIKNMERQKDTESYKKYIKNLHDCISYISMKCSQRIRLLSKINSAKFKYDDNIIQITIEGIRANEFIFKIRENNKKIKMLEEHLKNPSKRLDFSNVDFDGFKKHNPDLYKDLLDLLN